MQSDVFTGLRREGANVSLGIRTLLGGGHHSRLEAIARRLEAMASRLRPSQVGWRPSQVGLRPSQ